MGFKIKRPNSDRPVKQAGPKTCLFIAFFGLCLLGGGGFAFVKTKEFLATAIKVEGEIADVQQQVKTTHKNVGGVRQTYDEINFTPIVTFVDKTGRQVTFKDNGSTSFPTYSKGDKVTVLYSGKNPSGTATIDKGLTNWAWSIALATLGAVCLLFGIFGYSQARKPANA